MALGRAHSRAAGIRWRRATVTVAAAVMFALLAEPVLAGADDEPVDSLEARAENLATVVAGLEIPEPVDAESVTAQVVEPPIDPEAEPLPDDVPEGDDEQVVEVPGPDSPGGSGSAATSSGVGQVVVGGLLVGAAAVEGAPAPEAVSVRVSGQDEALDAGVTGVLLQVGDASPSVDGGATSVQLSFSYAQFAGLAGGDWASRLSVFRLEDCEATGEDQCRWIEVEGVTNDLTENTLSARIDLPAGTRGEVQSSSSPSSTTSSAVAADGVTGGVSLALAAGTSSGSGDWKATSLAPSAAWSASGSSGAFTWNYPMRVPDVPGGLVPNVALNYSSAASDGRTASTNNQASWVGEGFELNSSYVERKYLPCVQDEEGVDGREPNNVGEVVGDLCWTRDNATLVLDGSAIELVLDADGSWRAENDDGTRIERLSTGRIPSTDNDDAAKTARPLRDDNGEYWVVTTGEGLRYVFGSDLGKLEVDPTNSTWTVPVFGNHPGEACHETKFVDSSCRQAWRWNLRKVTDRSGNTMTYWYARERAGYRSAADGKAESTAVKALDYDTGGRLTKITYGTRGNLSSAAPAQVVFESVKRCRSTAGSCDETKMRANAQAWPDLPSDQYCAPGSSTSSCSQVYGPVFFNRYRLKGVKTQAYDGTEYKTIDSWALAHVWDAPYGRTGSGQAAGEILQLTSITHSGVGGKDGNPLPLPSVSFGWQRLANRVDASGDGLSPMWRPRLSTILSESGATTTVRYRKAECTPASVKTITVRSNSALCFPVNWAPKGHTKDAPDWFHKYVVESITDSGSSVDAEGKTLVTGSDPVTTTYTQSGAAWALPTGALVKPKEATYSEFRGFASVQTTVGEGNEASSTVTRYLQGLKNSKGEWRTVSSKPGALAAYPESEAVTIGDHERFVGMAYSVEQYDGQALVSQSVTAPASPKLTATPAWSGGDSAYRLDTVSTYGLMFDSSGTFERKTRVTTVYDSNANPVWTHDYGQVGLAGDELCTRYTYDDDITSNGVVLFGLPSRVEVVSKACDVATTRPLHVVSDTLTSYDTNGRIATTWQVDPDLNRKEGTLSSSTRAGYVPVSKVVEYDDYGRATKVRDAADHLTTTAYRQSGGGLLEEVAVTKPAPSSETPDFTTTTTYDPLTGNVVKQTDVNKRVTTAAYDRLGRLLSVRYPQHKDAPYPSVEYQYDVAKTGLNSVVTKTLGADGKTQHLGSAIYDGLMRVIQTQQESQAVASPKQSAAARGRVLTHTFYDSAGRISSQGGPWKVTGLPNGEMKSTPDSFVAETQYLYDGAGRQTDEILWETTKSSPTHELYRTVTVYDGSHTTVIPPRGGTATTTIGDARGRTTDLVQHRTRPEIKIALTGTSSVPGFDARELAASDTVSASYRYDGAGNLVSVSDSGLDPSTTGDDNSWEYTYDFAGRQVSADDPDAGKSSTTYDVLGQVTSTTNAAGEVVAYEYDSLGRSTSKTSNAGTVTFTYDTAQDTKGKAVLGQLASQTRSQGGASYTTSILEYDDAYQPLRTQLTLPDTGDLASLTKRDFVTEYSYTADGQIKTLKLPQVTKKGAKGGGTNVLGAETVTTYYDAASRAQWMAGGFGWGTYVAEAVHDDAGRSIVLDLGTTYGAAVSYSYDPATQRLTRIALDREQYSGTDLDIAYSYDDAGNLVSAFDVPSNKAANLLPDRQCYRYDGLRRLTEAFTVKASSCPKTAVNQTLLDGASRYWTSYTYDDLGNRTSQVQHATTSNGDDRKTTNTYGAGTAGPHALTGASVEVGTAAAVTDSYSYDKAGRQDKRQLAGASQQELTWDGEGELRTVETNSTIASFVYDANGDRLTRTDSSGTTVYLPGGQEILVTAADGVKSAIRYYGFDGQTVAVRDKNGLGGVTTLVGDPHGTTLAAIPNTKWAANSVVKQYTDPFGAARGTAASIPGGRQFLDKTRDNATGLTMVGARYYDEANGRFISVDPVLDLADPQQWNAYAYANNNPTTYSDPSGLTPRIDDDYDGGRGPLAKRPPAQATTPWMTYPRSPRLASPARRAADTAFNLLSTWMSSDTGRTLSIYGPPNSSRVNSMLSAIIRAKSEGGVKNWLRTVGEVPITSGDWQAVSIIQTIRTKFPDKGEWDAKVPLGEEFGVHDRSSSWLPTGDGSYANYDIFGNVIYGYMLSYAGVTEANAIAAANLNIPGTGVGDTRDDISVTLGYELAARDPRDLNSVEFYRFLLVENRDRLYWAGAMK